MKSISEELNLNNKKILLRLDLNVPLIDDKITDTTRIDKILPTLKFLISQNTKIIIISHVGRPKGQEINELSLRPICQDLEIKLSQNIKLISKDIREIASKDLFDNDDEKIVMLENIRFYPEEEKNNPQFAKQLASLADIYVNDAFSCSHRAHASIHYITNFLPSYSGLQLDLEVDALKKITSEIKKPITCIIGGSKVSTKINIIKNLIPKFDNIIIVGGMANNIIKYMGNQIGKSLQEENSDPIIKEIFSLSEINNCKIICPEDIVVGKNLNGSPQIKELSEISSDEMILDIGPKTIKVICNIIDESNNYYDSKQLSPIGTDPGTINFHIWLESFLFNLNNIGEDSSIGEKTSSIFLIPVIFAIFSAIPIFFILRKFSNDLFALFED